MVGSLFVIDGIVAYYPLLVAMINHSLALGLTIKNEYI